MPYCSKCGSQVDEDALFCTHCGAPIKEQANPTTNDQQHGWDPASGQAKRPASSAPWQNPFFFTDMLDNGEVLCRESEFNRMSIVPYLIIAAVCVIDEAVVAGVFFTAGAFLFLLILTAVFFLILIEYTYIRPMRFRKLAFTNRRVIGYIRNKSFYIPLDKISDVSVTRRSFGCGTLKISSFSQSYRFYYIDQAQEFRDELMHQIEFFEKEKNQK